MNVNFIEKKSTINKHDFLYFTPTSLQFLSEEVKQNPTLLMSMSVVFIFNLFEKHNIFSEVMEKIIVDDHLDVFCYLYKNSLCSFQHPCFISLNCAEKKISMSIYTLCVLYNRAKMINVIHHYDTLYAMQKNNTPTSIHKNIWQRLIVFFVFFIHKIQSTFLSSKKNVVEQKSSFPENEVEKNEILDYLNEARRASNSVYYDALSSDDKG